MFKRVDDIDVLRSMSYMVDAGISIQEAIEEISENIKDDRMISRLDTSRDLMINHGYKFTEAMEEAGLFLDYLPIIKTGQETGNLPRVLREIISTGDKITAVKKKMRTTAVYPVALIFIAIAIGFGITFLLEKVLTTLPKKDIKGTPAYDMAKFLIEYRSILFPVYAAVIAGVLWWMSKNMSKIPVIKTIFNAVSIGQTFKMLSLALKNGLSLKESIDLTSLILRDKKWKAAFEAMSADAQEKSMYEIIDEMTEFIPSMDMLILKTNIKAGSIPTGFDFVGDRKIADSYTILERISPLIQITALIFVAIQVVLIMSPLYAILLEFAGKN